MKPKLEANKNNRPTDVASGALLGHFFHSVVGEDGKIEWQGSVIANPLQGWYLVQLFGWLDGIPNVQRLVRIEDMESWLFYNDTEMMQYSYEHGVARAGGKYRAPEPQYPRDKVA
jgi:hypothetical protein